MTTLEALKAARELISDPAKWTQGVLARDGEGAAVSPRSAEAVCWCAAGSLHKVLPARTKPESFDAIYSSLEAISPNPVFYNDTHTHAEVMAMVDRAIEIAGSK